MAERRDRAATGRDRGDAIAGRSLERPREAREPRGREPSGRAPAVAARSGPSSRPARTAERRPARPGPRSRRSPSRSGSGPGGSTATRCSTSCRVEHGRSPSRCSRATSRRCGPRSTRRTRAASERGETADRRHGELLAHRRAVASPPPHRRVARRAEAALADVDEIDLRDLRSVVVAADARRATTRRASSRHSSARRSAAASTASRPAWLAEMTRRWTPDAQCGRCASAHGRRRPAPSSTRRSPPTDRGRERVADGRAAPDRWGVVLEAVAFSPVRLAVRPVSLPETPSDELIAAVRKLASRMPQIAAAFGIEPRPPRRAGRAARRSRRSPSRPPPRSRPSPPRRAPPRPTPPRPSPRHRPD